MGGHSFAHGGGGGGGKAKRGEKQNTNLKFPRKKNTSKKNTTLPTLRGARGGLPDCKQKNKKTLRQKCTKKRNSVLDTRRAKPTKKKRRERQTPEGGGGTRISVQLGGKDPLRTVWEGGENRTHKKKKRGGGSNTGGKGSH